MSDFASSSGSSSEKEVDTYTTSWTQSYGSHIVSVVIGMIVTFVVIRFVSSHRDSDTNNSNKNHRTETKTTTTTTSGNATTTSSSNKKKKKTRKKSNGSTNNGTNSNTNGTNKSAPVSVKIVEDPVLNKGVADSTTMTTTTTSALPKDSAVEKKKNKNKAKTNGNAVVTPADSEKGTNGSNNTHDSSKEKIKSETVNHPNATPIVEETTTTGSTFYDYDPRQTKQEEEIWETIPNNKSKKKKGNSNKAKVAAATAQVDQAPTTTTVATNVSETVSFDATKVGIIIGPKGTTMQAIQAATGCKLDVQAPTIAATKPEDVKVNTRGNNRAPQQQNQHQQATVVISEGTPDNIQKAKKAIQELVTRGYATLLQAETFGEQSLTVHPRCLSEIVGPGGKTIQALQSAFNVKITIPKTDWKPNGMSPSPQVGMAVPTCKVGIAGDDKTQVKNAKQTIQQLLQYHHTEITHPGIIHQEIYVPQEFFHCVIGTRGSEIKHIRGNFKVDVYMPNHDNNNQENVLVVGKPTPVDKAIAYIQLLMDRDSEQRAQKYSDDYY